MRTVYGDKNDIDVRAKRMMINGVDVRMTNNGYDIYYEEQIVFRYIYKDEFEQMRFDWR